jgi:hypothetical protein
MIARFFFGQGTGTSRLVALGIFAFLFPSGTFAPVQGLWYVVENAVTEILVGLVKRGLINSDANFTGSDSRLINI